MKVEAGRVVTRGIAVAEVASVPCGMALPKPEATLDAVPDCVRRPAVAPAVMKGNNDAWLDPMPACPVAQ